MISEKNKELYKLILKKLDFYKKIIQKTIKSQEYYKYLEIIVSSEYNNCLVNLELLYNKCSILKNKIQLIINDIETHENGDNIKINDITKVKNEDICNIGICIIDKKNEDNNSIITNHKSKEKNKHTETIEVIINSLQEINDGLFLILKSNGTKTLEDLLMIVFGNKYPALFLNNDKYDTLNVHFKPTSFIMLDDDDNKNDKDKDKNIKIKSKSKSKSKNSNMKKSNNSTVKEIVKEMDKSDKTHEEVIDKDNISIENTKYIENKIMKTMDCIDIGRETTNFNKKLYGLKVIFINKKERKTIIVTGIVDNIIFDLYDNHYIHSIINDINKNIPHDDKFKNNDFQNFINCLTLRDILVYSNEDLYNRFNGYINQVEMMKQRPVAQIVREFINDNLYIQRTKIIQLLIKNDSPEHQYLCYLLYDLLSNDDKGVVDTKEQILIYDSLPWKFKKLFKIAMKTTIDYTSKLRNSNTSEIQLEQQICLMKVDDNVKEKAMVKLKEVKAKNEDGGLKARQYIDGLLKIPFGIYRHEPILKLMKDNITLFKNIIYELKKYKLDDNKEINYVVNQDETNNLLEDNSINLDNILIKNTYTPMEIYKYKEFIKEEYIPILVNKQYEYIVRKLTYCKREELVYNINKINTCIIKGLNIKIPKLIHSGKKIHFLKNEITQFIKSYINNPNTKPHPGMSDNTNNNNNTLNINNSIIRDSVIEGLFTTFNLNNTINIEKINNQIDEINNKWDFINKNMSCVRDTLDKAVYGHNKAKRQIERIIGQWMTGEQTGYCFGFEGPPGVGKTSLAKKGLAQCLSDEDGISRPFGFIAIGGSSNSSTLDGHSYTYVGSTWGRIVDILIESKCMNPIIFIDELDKISKTEQGKEIIGILTHLVDPTQNDTFQDKYFNGINIDLSKVLFVFSYNDASLLDKILLDRIHRVKFSSQSTEQKIIITRDYILPDIYEKLNMTDMIHVQEEAIQHIIEYYTYESGVRKLKEVLFEIISEINLEILNNNLLGNIEIPYNITIDNIKDKYLKHRDEIPIKKIHDNPEIGIINGLWANAIGQGGIIPIQCNLFPSGSLLDLKLTGMQGDVMKESMNVAKTLAYKLTPLNKQKQLIIDFKKTQLQGIHIHCPEGATPKDGPSAGTAITCCIYSSLNNLKIKNTVAITGEINLQGYVTAIGGLDLKILGGIRAGVKEFIFPKENQKDFDKFWLKYGEKDLVKNISFSVVEHINDVFKLIF